MRNDRGIGKLIAHLQEFIGQAGQQAVDVSSFEEKYQLQRNLPIHLFVPSYGRPWLVKQYNLAVPNAIAGAGTVLASFTVPQDASAYIDFVTEDLQNFSPGVNPQTVEFRLIRASGSGIPPYERFQGPLQGGLNPLRWRTVDQIQAGETIQLIGRVIPAAENGVAGTVDIDVQLAGWTVPK